MYCNSLPSSILFQDPTQRTLISYITYQPTEIVEIAVMDRSDNKEHKQFQLEDQNTQID